MVNPYNSPWLKPLPTYIRDIKLRANYDAIKKHATSRINFVEHNGILCVNKNIYVSKHSTKFRIRSHLDWAWYTPKTFAQAIDSNTVETYYEFMLNDIHSDPNIWKDSDLEMEMKSFYAARAQRASLL